MRSASRFLALAALLAGGCGTPADPEGDELRKLESALGDLGSSPQDEWADRLDALKRMPIASPRIAAVRAKCAGAYGKFAQATAGLAAAREDVARLEDRIARAAADAGSAYEIARLHEQARRATDGVTAALDAAERLVGECGEARRALRREAGAP